MSQPGDPLGALAGGRRPSWSAFRAALEEAGFRPSKTLGQNFLIDPNAARAIAGDAQLAPGTQVLEVGAGCGFLTLHLAERGLEILAVEIDARLLAVAQRLLAGRRSVRWLQADAMAGKHALSPQLSSELPGAAPWHLVSNLPYSISAPLLAVLARLPDPPRTMTVLVQEEVARRLAAKPGDPDWGALTAHLRFSYRASAGRAVGPQLFWPRPRVASRVVRLSFEALAGAEAEDGPAFDALVTALFQHRRKQLLAALAERLGDRRVAEVMVGESGLDPRSRPEVLRPEDLLALARSPHWKARVP